MNKYLKIGLFVCLVWWTQFAFAQNTIPVNTYYSFEATYTPGYTYSWWYIGNAGDTTYFSSNSNKTEEYYWDTKGDYELFVQASDGNNCLSEIITKNFIVSYKSNDLGNFAGKDTTIVECQPIVLGGEITDEEKYNFLWEPGEKLNDPTSATPAFTPGNTTIFKLTVTNSLGVSVVDSVEITVSEIIAEAGDDVLMYENSSSILDGTGSIGSDLQYNWTTISGKIDSGKNNANPIVSGFGMYYLEVTNTFGCIAIDSVRVERLSYAPVAVDDYDTTTYLTEVKIAVLDNDIDPDADIDLLSLAVTRAPFYGTAYVDYNDFTLHYTPNQDFFGNDKFEYQICDLTKNCDKADVYVLVTEYEFLIPDAFSPNGDNINDYFEIIGIDKYEGNSISILNRWGNRVYKAENYGISTTPRFWDGKSNTGFLFGDQELPTGTYYYVLNLGNGVKSIAGSIYLDR